MTDFRGTGEPQGMAPAEKAITEELIAAAISGVINSARAKGESLDDLKAQLLADDQVLDRSMRFWLSEVVAEAWSALP